MAGEHVAAPAVGSDEALDAGVGLDDDGYAPEWAGVEAGLFGFGVFAGGRGERGLRVDCLHGAIDAVVTGDAVKMPLDDLRDRVAVRAVELVQMGDGGFHQIMVDCVAMRQRMLRAG